MKHVRELSLEEGQTVRGGGTEWRQKDGTWISVYILPPWPANFGIRRWNTKYEIRTVIENKKLVRKKVRVGLEPVLGKEG